jgi:hypothetical protein
MRDEQALPTAGQIWSRATLRARIEAARHARPSMTMPAIAGAAAIGLLVVLAVRVWPWVTSAFVWMVGAATRMDPAAAHAGDVLVALVQWSMPLIVAASVLLLVAAASVYLALTD